MSASTEQLQALLEPEVSALGYEFVGLEFTVQGRHRLLRIYIDNDNGVTVDDCAIVSRQISAVLDIEDPIPGEYTLEVSSPGIERPLFTLDHYQRFIGERVKFKTRRPLTFVEGKPPRRNFDAVIKGINNSEIQFEVENQLLTLTLEEIEKAHLVVLF